MAQKVKTKNVKCLIRAYRNSEKGKYLAQARRTQANKARRVERMMRRFPGYRAPGWVKSGLSGRMVRL